MLTRRGYRIVGLFLAPALMGGRALADLPTLDRLTINGLEDLQATVTVVKADTTELGKINRDFALMYRVKDLTMHYKEPDKVRIEGRVGMLIFNGAQRLFKVPSLRMTRRDNLNGQPGKRYSLFDIGLITKNALSMLQGRFLREDRLEDAPVYVFEVSYRGEENARYVAWIDQKTHVILKREWYNGEGKIRATFLFQNLKEVRPGLWIPTRLEIRNGEGVVAGITAYSELKVNQGLDDSLFDVT